MTKRRLLCLAAAVLLTAAPSCPAETAEATPVPLGVRIPWTPAPTEVPAKEEATLAPVETVLLEEATPGEAQGWTTERLSEAGVGGRILRRGMRGADVLLVQTRLIELGFLAGEADGVYGRLTVEAVERFQRASSLEKVDGKTGEETLERLFGKDVVPRATPVPTFTPQPTASPTPTPSPTPMPRSTAVPAAEGAPFDAAEKSVYVGETKITLLLGQAEGQTLYPLCGVLMHRGFDCTASGGVWETKGPSGETVTLYAQAQDGRVDGALGALGDTLLLCDAPVYVYGPEVWVPARVLSQIGLHIVELEEASVIW